MDLDSRILPYIYSNDPLPPSLKPVLDAQLETLRALEASCDEHIDVVQAGISEAEQGIRGTESDISALHKDLATQKETRDRLREDIQQLNNVTSIIRRIPPEVIASIITFALFDGISATPTSRDFRSICAVSALWRRIIASTPSLWRSLTVGLDCFATRGKAKLHPHESLNSWLSRAGEGTEITLSLRMRRRRHFNQNQRILSLEVLRWIETSNFNVVSLTLRGIFPSFDQLEAFFATRAPSLRRMKKLAMDLPPPPPTTRTIDISSMMPNLEQLQAEICPFGPCVLSIFFVHTSLATLELTSGSLISSDILKLLDSLPDLQSLTLGRCFVDKDDEEEPMEVSLFPPLTHSLREILVHETTITHLPDGLICPLLERLCPAVGWTNAASARVYGEFIRRSQPSNLTLQVKSLPAMFLNVLLSTSSPYITTLDVPSAFDLPLDETELVIPSFIALVRCRDPLTEQERSDFVSKLGARLEHSSQTLNVTFGEGSSAMTVHIN